MGKIYTRVNWQGAPSTVTPVGPGNLNKMDKGIDDLDNIAVALSDNLVAKTYSISLGAGYTASNNMHGIWVDKNFVHVYFSIAGAFANSTIVTVGTIPAGVLAFIYRPGVFSQGTIYGYASDYVQQALFGYVNSAGAIVIHVMGMATPLVKVSGYICIPRNA